MATEPSLAALGQLYGNDPASALALMKAWTEQLRQPGNRADPNLVVPSGGAPANYGVYPPVMDQLLPDFARYQKRSIE